MIDKPSRWRVVTSRFAIAVLSVASLGTRGTAAGEQCTPWELISPHPHGRNLTDVVWGGDRFVAVGYSVTQWSADGETWQVAVHDGVHLNGVGWDGAAYVAVGDGGAILRSSDGADWDGVVSPTPANLTGVAWGNGTYLVVAADGTAYGSTTGLTWEPVPIPTPRGALRGVAFGEGTFCIFGDNSTLLVGSAAGWSDVNPTSHRGTLTAAAILKGRVYVGETYGTGVDWIVDNGVWTEVESPAGSFLGREGSELFIVGTYGSSPRQIFSSLDGSSWTHQPIPDGSFTVRALAIGGDRVVAVGNYGVQLLKRESGSWVVASGSAHGFSTLASDGRLFVLGTTEYQPGRCSILSSLDGREWTCRQPDDGAWRYVSRVSWQQDRFLALLDFYYNRVAHSPDGVSWALPTRGEDPPFIWGYPTDILRFRGRYFAFWGFDPPCWVTCARAYAQIWSSTDLQDWTEAWSDTSKRGLARAASNGTRMVATLCCKGELDLDELEGLVTSDDGMTWSVVSLPEPMPPTTTIVWTGSRFVAGGGSTVMESPDGLQWRVVSRPSFSIRDLAWTGSALLAAGSWQHHPLVASSPDGVLWVRTFPLLQPQPEPKLPAFPGSPNSSIQAVAGTPRIQVAAGANGTLLRRECVPEPFPVRRRLGRGGASRP